MGIDLKQLQIHNEKTNMALKKDSIWPVYKEEIRAQWKFSRNGMLTVFPGQSVPPLRFKWNSTGKYKIFTSCNKSFKCNTMPTIHSFKVYFTLENCLQLYSKCLEQMTVVPILQHWHHMDICTITIYMISLYINLQYIYI